MNPKRKMTPNRTTQKSNRNARLTGERHGMKVSEYIAKLSQLLVDHGDMDVVTHQSYGVMGSFRTATAPKISEQAILNGRERTDRLILFGDTPDRHSGKFYVEI